MIQRYDLLKMLEEIKVDEQVIKEKQDRWASQSDIREMVAAMKTKRQTER